MERRRGSFPGQLPDSIGAQDSVPSDRTEDGFGIADLMTLLHDLVYILAFVSIIFSFCFRMITVEGDSMQPTLQHKDRLVLQSNLWYTQPKAGDLVVALVPSFSADPIVKRVIAVEGDVVNVDFETGAVMVNGETLQEDYLMEAPTQNSPEQGIDFPVTIEPGCVFLMGDNRNVSYDSRYAPIGQVDTRFILGRVVFLLFPGTDRQTQTQNFGRIGWIG